MPLDLTALKTYKNAPTPTKYKSLPKKNNSFTPFCFPLELRNRTTSSDNLLTSFGLHAPEAHLCISVHCVTSFAAHI
jgi:hypothetical protein